MDGPSYLHAFFALAFVLALMGLLWLALRKFGLVTPLSVSAEGKRRLKVVEVLPLDHRRRLVLIRRDDREHLVILGPNGETVVETGITAPRPNEKV